MNTFGLSFVGRFVLFRSVLYRKFLCITAVFRGDKHGLHRLTYTEKNSLYVLSFLFLAVLSVGQLQSV